MVVVFIIGLITAVAVITFGGDRRDTELDQEAERLDALFDYVREQAELQTRDYGFRVNDRSYSFVVFDVIAEPVAARRRRRRLARAEISRRHRAAGGGRRTAASCSTAEERDIEDFKPQVMIFANGDLSSFEVSLRREDGGDQRAHLHRRTDQRSSCCCPGEDEPTRTAGAHGATHDETPCIAHRGFTLLEVLIALAIVAMSVGRLAGHGHLLRQQRHLSQGQDAGRMGGAQPPHRNCASPSSMPDVGKRTGNAVMGGMRWEWEEEVTELPVEGPVSHRRARPCHRRVRR